MSEVAALLDKIEKTADVLRLRQDPHNRALFRTALSAFGHYSDRELAEFIARFAVELVVEIGEMP